MQAAAKETCLPGKSKTPRWRNLVFTKSGSSHLGTMVWPNERRAQEAADLVDAELSRLDKLGDVVWIITEDINVLWQDYSHTMQIPWLGN